MACAHGCGVERSVEVVGLFAIDVPSELRHDHQRLHRRDGRFHCQFVLPFVREVAHGVRWVGRGRSAVGHVPLVGVAEEVADDACALIAHVVVYVEIYFLAEPVLQRSAEQRLHVVVAAVVVLPQLFVALFAQIPYVAVGVRVLVRSAQVGVALQRERTFLSDEVLPLV